MSMSLDADIAPKTPSREADRPDANPRIPGSTSCVRLEPRIRGPSGYAMDTISVNFHGNSPRISMRCPHFIFNGHTYNGCACVGDHRVGERRKTSNALQGRLMTRGVSSWPRFKNVPYMA